jgi:hypothetical protein
LESDVKNTNVGAWIFRIAARVTSTIRGGRVGLAGLALLASSPACVGETSDVDPGGESGTATVGEEIIGGSLLNPDVDTRRSMGLVNVGTGCSGALFHRDWVITATHCLNRNNVGSNQFSIPRTDAGFDTRTATHITALSTSDISIVQLSAVTAGMMWPNVTRTMNTTSPNSLVGQNIICYGRGNTAYKNPGPGVEGFGTWKSLTKTIAALESHATKGPELRINATGAGNDIIAYGDSGGACFIGNQITAVVTSTRAVECTDPTNDDTCKSTTTKIGGAGLRVTSTFANYIGQAPSRTAHAQFYPITVNSGWTLYNHSFPLPEYSLSASNTMVQLRGMTKTTVANTAPFTLPSSARPSARVYVPVVVISGSGYSNGRLVIEANGTTAINFEGATPALPHSITLDGIQFARSNANTTAPTLHNGWVAAAFSTRAPRVRNVGNMVYLQGAISNPSSAANAHAMTLPEGFRPSSNVYIPVDMCGSTRGRLFIQSSGTVSVQTEGAFSNATCFTSLEGAAFAITTAGYTSATYENSWSGAPFNTRQVRFINEGGVVRFQGAAANGTSVGVFTLPAQFRPATAQLRWIDGFAAKKTLLYVDPSGIVMSLPLGGGHDGRFSSFEGATFGL